MKNDPPERLQELEPLLELARRELTGAPPRRDAASLSRVQRHLEARLRRWRTEWLVGGVTVLVAAVLALVVWTRQDTPLGMEVLVGELSGPGQVGPSSQTTTIRFSDGTHVTVDANARAQVSSISAVGADVRLERGQVRLHVSKRPGASWNVLAGAYRVHVTGTQFAVAFDEAADTLEVELFSGSVRVDGPLVEPGINVIRGQRLSLEPRRGKVEVGRGTRGSELPAAVNPTEAEALASPPDAALVEPEPKPSFQPSKPHAAVAKAVTLPSWRSRVVAGQFAEVLAAAEQRGLDGVYAQASLEDLDALADAARYQRRSPVAREALLGIRRRFPASAQAKQAAFLIGRLLESSSEPWASALGWYERYLAEDPNGAYASQALGRKLVIIHRERGATLAEPIAREYLKRFPRGPYASNAKKLAPEP